MKRKIAVFSTGWSEQMISEYMTGVHRRLKDENSDVYVFLCYSTLSDVEEYAKGELNIFKLPNMCDFDGALVLGNTIDFVYVLQDIGDRCKAANIPVVCTGNKIEGAYSVNADNYSGAKQLSDHLYNDHGIRDFFYIAGAKENSDSNIRIQALKDTIRENGGCFSDDNIFYSNWSPRETIIFIGDWLRSGKKLPEAFLCANDDNAILVCEELRKFGVKVPEDVVVTGFDNILYAQVYDPSISSVSQRFEEIGFESANLLLEVLEGKKPEKEQLVPCEFALGESCGCKENSNIGVVRREIGRNRYMDGLRNSAFYRKLSIIDRYIMRSKGYEDIKVNYKCTSDAINNYEGVSYHVMLDSAYREKMYDAKVEYRMDGYAEKMDVVFSIDEGNYLCFDGFETRRIVPQIQNPDRGHLFICLPLQETGNCLGYVVLADDYSKFSESMLMGKYVEQLSAILVKLQQTVNARILNEKLTELSETDALTSVKNRTAYQVREVLINEKIKRGECGDFAILLCDLNSLKAVNDKRGHESGDVYIKNSCKLICKTFKRSAVYRIGGDEFVVLLEGEDYKNYESLIEAMNNEMSSLEKMNIPACDKVSIAAGIAYFDINMDTCVNDVLKRADEKMYARKKEMKSLTS